MIFGLIVYKGIKMKSSAINKVVLELGDFEVQWLRNIMQNPIGCSYEEELGGDREMRKKFWEALGGDGVHNFWLNYSKDDAVAKKVDKFFKTDPDDCSILNKFRIT